MSTRSDARQWLRSHYGAVAGTICSSKFFKPEESWTGHEVWWHQIPLSNISDCKERYVHLLCQAAPQQIKYHYLKVPIPYFQEHMAKLDIVAGKIILHLSAEPKSLFVDHRRKSLVPFGQFLISNDAS
jgi:hypothetical protein